MQETQAKTLQSEGGSLEERLFAVEAERDCRELLARYSLYADHFLSDQWVGLFTADGIMDFTYFEDTGYFDENMVPTTVDPTTVDFPLRNARFAGTAELHDCIEAPRHQRLQGGCQHQMDGQPAVFRLINAETAVLISDSIVYARSVGNRSSTIQYQHHCLNRWTFRRVDGVWLIAENIRRTMGSGETAELLAGI
jgi:hypothetical protein